MNAEKEEEQQQPFLDFRKLPVLAVQELALCLLLDLTLQIMAAVARLSQRATEIDTDYFDLQR